MKVSEKLGLAFDVSFIMSFRGTRLFACLPPPFFDPTQCRMRSLLWVPVPTGDGAFWSPFPILPSVWLVFIFRLTDVYPLTYSSCDFMLNFSPIHYVPLRRPGHRSYNAILPPEA